MDANNFIREYNRMCSSFHFCTGCPLHEYQGICVGVPAKYTNEFASKVEKVVEAWSAAHPITTRADLFKKMHPNAPTYEDGSMHICPHDIDKYFMCPDDYDCGKCRKNYWLKEVQNER